MMYSGIAFMIAGILFAAAFHVSMVGTISSLHHVLELCTVLGLACRSSKQPAQL